LSKNISVSRLGSVLKFAAATFREKWRPLPQDEALSVNSRQCWNHWLLLTLGDALSEGKDSRSPSGAGSVLPRPSVSVCLLFVSVFRYLSVYVCVFFVFVLCFT
jgi:hypothetical protein